MENIHAISATRDTHAISATKDIRTISRKLFKAGDIVELRLIHENKRKPALKRWTTAQKLESKVDKLVALNVKGYNIYFGVNPRKESKKSGDRNVKMARCLFCDFDNIEPRDGCDRLNSIRDDIVLKGLPEPTIMVNSGHGLHAYWRLDKPIIDLKKWKSVQERLNHSLGADPAIKNPEHFMRLPGFLNTKRMPYQDRFVCGHPAPPVKLSDFDNLPQVDTPPSQAPHGSRKRQIMENTENKHKPQPAHWLNETSIPQNKRLILDKDMIRSKAFVKLTRAAKQILLELYMRLTIDCLKPGRSKRDPQFYASNNGHLKLSYRDCKKMFGYSSSTTSRAIDRLVDNGFIEIAKLGHGIRREQHKFALVKNWRQYGTPDFRPGKGKANRPINGGFKKATTFESGARQLSKVAQARPQNRQNQAQQLSKVAR